MLTDIAFNPGIAEYPSFIKAIISGDEEGMALEPHRFMTNTEGNKVPLGRNKDFASRYRLRWEDPWRAKVLSRARKGGSSVGRRSPGGKRP